MPNASLIDRLLAVLPALPVETAERVEAITAILAADVRALPLALQILRYDYKGKAPMRLDAWADAIDAAYRAGF